MAMGHKAHSVADHGKGMVADRVRILTNSPLMGEPEQSVVELPLLVPSEAAAALEAAADERALALAQLFRILIRDFLGIEDAGMSGLADRTPQNTGSPVSRELMPSQVSVRAATRRVLIADPCADTVESTAWLLRAWGYDVRRAASGSEALEVAHSYRPDAVIMELGLPGLNGCKVARRLRQHGPNPQVFLVAVTGYGDAKNRRRCLEAGFNCHLVKPVEPDVLQSLLATSHRDSGGR
jgi:CheY-like chemotaxis protein